MDTFSRKRRSEIMALIRSVNTQPERIVRSVLHRIGFRFRLNDKRLPGKPDIVLARYKSVVFVHGCFWHQHRSCKDGRRPKSNTAYWNRKIDRNLRRDKINAKRLRSLGWKRIVVWGCQLRNKEGLKKRLYSELTCAKT